MYKWGTIKLFKNNKKIKKNNTKLYGELRMTKWLKQIMYCYDPVVMSSNPSRVELGMHSASKLSRIGNFGSVFLLTCSTFHVLGEMQ